MRIRTHSAKEERSALLGCLAVVSIIILTFAGYGWTFGEMFPLIEYRQWINASTVSGEFKVFLDQAIWHAGGLSWGFSRATSFLGVSLIEQACGLSIVCHNLSLMLLIAASAFCLIFIVWKLVERVDWKLLGAAMLFFLLSIPMLDAVSWQATSLDKFGLLLTSVTVLLAAVVPVSGSKLSRQWVTRLAFLVLVVLAVNAKEAAWTLVISVGLLLGLRSLRNVKEINLVELWIAARASLSVTWPALVYTAFHCGLSYASLVLSTDNPLQRVTSGDPIRNLREYSRYLFNMEKLPEGWSLPYAGLLICSMLFVGFLVFSGRASRHAAILWIWSTASFLIAMLIPLRTSGASPFYLLVPAIYLAIAFYGSLSIIAGTLQGAARYASLLVLCMVIGVHIFGFVRAAPFYLGLASMSRNVLAALPVVGEEIARRPPTSLVFVYPQEVARAYMFVGSTGPGAAALARYILPRGSSRQVLRALDSVIMDSPAPAGGVVSPPPGGLAVVLDGELKLTRLIRGD